MERFVKINKQVKNNLFKICRLCGIDNPNKIGILEEVVFLSDDGDIEPPLYKKIFNCVGIHVTQSDKMPKTICALCFDKINDFHEFREMCYVTNVQTRKLLGLSEQPKVELKWEDGGAVLNPLSAAKGDTDNKKSKIEKKGKKRKNAEPPPENTAKNIKLENFPDPIKSEIKIEDEIPINKINKKIKAKVDKTLKNDISKGKNTPKGKIEKSKTEKSSKTIKQEPRQIMCNICRSAFTSAALLQSHLLKIHVPLIDRYFCVRCNESMDETMQIKSHNLWHKLSKTPYQCGRCDKLINSLQGLTKHTRECPLASVRNLVKISPNVVCKFCSVEFQTKNLFFMHPCITSTLHCPKCKCKLSNQSNTLKHIATCSARIRNEEEMDYVIKTEPVELPPLVPLSLPLVDPPITLSSLPIPSVSKSKASKINQSGQVIPLPSVKENRNSRPSHTMVVIPSSSTVQVSDSELVNKKPLRNPTSLTDDVLSSTSCEDEGSGKSKITAKKHKEEAMMARCSVLLQDTLRTLVNIKQEPVDSSIEKRQNEETETEIHIENFPTSHIKQEVVDENYKEVETDLEINIKQEVITYPTISQPPLPALKLKIKKEHGTLNSSFIENSENEASVLESQKKKKPKNSKKKNKESETSSIEDGLKSPSVEDPLPMENSLLENVITEKVDFPQPITIKAERIDPDYEENENDCTEDDVSDFHCFDDYDSGNEKEHEVSEKANESSLPIIASIKSGAETLEAPVKSDLNNTLEKENCTENLSSPLLKISSVSSLKGISGQLNKSSNNLIDSNNESPDESSVQVNNKNCLIPQIVAVSCGILSTESISKESFNKIEEHNNIIIPQISHISSGVQLEKNTSDINNEFDYTNIVIKEEPDFGDYFDCTKENVNNDNHDFETYNEKDEEDMSDNINGENNNEDDSNELEDNEDVEENIKITDNITKEFKVNKVTKRRKSNLNKNKSSIKKLLIQNLKENYVASDDLSSEINAVIEECPDNNTIIKQIIPEAEIEFDPNIKIKQEIEFTEESFVDDDQYEYGSDNEDNDGFEYDYNNSEFTRGCKSPSPIKDLQPIIMEFKEKKEQLDLKNNFSNSTNANLENNIYDNSIIEENYRIAESDISKDNKVRDIDNNHSESCNETDQFDNFGFKKIKLNMTAENTQEDNFKSIATSSIESDCISFDQNTAVLGLTISSISHLTQKNIGENVSENMDTYTGNIENPNHSPNTSIISQNVSEINMDTYTGNIENPNHSPNTSIISQNVSEINMDTYTENIENPNPSNTSIISQNVAEINMDYTENIKNPNPSNTSKISQNVSEINMDTYTENVENPNHSPNTSIILQKSTNILENSAEQSLSSNESNEQFSIRLRKLENINEIAENHNNENFEKMLRNEVVENETAIEEEVHSNAPIVVQNSSTNFTDTNENNEN